MSGFFKGFKNEMGTTLTELLVVSFMVVAVLGAVLALIDASLNNYMSQVNRATTQDSARLAMQRMSKEIRQAEKPLLQVTSTSSVEAITFKADVDNNGTSEAIRYELNRSQAKITRQVNPSGAFDFSQATRDPVVDYVRNSYPNEPVFTYYATYPGTPLTFDMIDKAKVMRIWLKVDQDLSKSPALVEVVTFVKLRDFGY